MPRHLVAGKLYRTIDDGKRLMAQEPGWQLPPNANVANLEKLDEEDVWFGTLRVFGVSLHVYAIRVKRNADGDQVATKDPCKRLDDALSLDTDCWYKTARIPGLPGRYVIYAFPFGD